MDTVQDETFKQRPTPDKADCRKRLHDNAIGRGLSFSQSCYGGENPHDPVAKYSFPDGVLLISLPS
jgi:hypothetical protein